MEAQVVTIDQPFHCAYEKFLEITDHLSTEMAGDKTLYLLGRLIGVSQESQGFGAINITPDDGIYSGS